MNAAVQWDSVPRPNPGLPGDPVLADLAAHLARDEAAERWQDWQAERYEAHHAAYCGELYDAIGYDDQEADVAALALAVECGELANARGALTRIIGRAADQYARAKVREEIRQLP